MSSDEIIYNKLLNAIVQQQLPPGARLPEDRLCEAFNVSRTGIRKVLQRLAIERFVVIQPHKGAQVNKPDVREANEVLDSRILIEPQLIPNLILNWNLKESERFRHMVANEIKAVVANELSTSIQLTAKFHYELAKVAGNEILANFVEQLCYRSSLVLAAYGSRNSESCNCSDHNELIDILDSGDVLKAQNWMKHHLQQIKSSIIIESKTAERIDFQSLFSVS